MTDADRAAPTARIAVLTQEIAREETNIATLNSQLALRQDEQRLAVQAQQALRNATDQTRTNNKHDALSVFGSFNGHVVAGTENPASGATVNTTLNLGRVFSTGVASQHLTEGIEQSATVSAVTQCLAAAQRSATGSPAPTREETLRILSLACTPEPVAHD